MRRSGRRVRRKDYALINMAGRVDVIDQIGGIDIQVTADEREWLNEAIQDYLSIFGDYEGETSLDRSGDSVHLNGLLAITFCRSNATGLDDAVTLRQRRVLLAVLGKLKDGGPCTAHERGDVRGRTRRDQLKHRGRPLAGQRGSLVRRGFD